MSGGVNLQHYSQSHESLYWSCKEQQVEVGELSVAKRKGGVFPG